MNGKLFVITILKNKLKITLHKSQIQYFIFVVVDRRKNGTKITNVLFDVYVYAQFCQKQLLEDIDGKLT